MGANKYKILEMDPMLEKYEEDINLRMELLNKKKSQILSGEAKSLSDFANGYMYYGIHRCGSGWIYREWAPHAESASIIGDFNKWNGTANPMIRLENGNWEVYIDDSQGMKSGQRVKVHFYADGKYFDRIPAYIRRAEQDPDGKFCGQVWEPETPFKWTDGRFFKRHSIKKPLIYECHIGMSGEEERISTYTEFKNNVLPRIIKDGYNCIQVMAVMEHPYYASFGYQVSNLFAPSSRFGTPEELKDLINTAHKSGVAVLLDIIHSHHVKNTVEGLGMFDGTDYQYFHSGKAGEHPSWNTRLYNYSKNDVIHFLLSNVKYWSEEFHFDGFRFDGVTSMLYHNHGIGEDFDDYKKYFSLNTDTDAITYLQLANELIHELNPKALTIAEDMSGMPGMCLPVEYGGIGFDYRLSMGVPDFWIKTLKGRDEDWNLGRLWYELNTRRPGEKAIGYCESHDQALVGDKTIMFRLADKEMYAHMDKGDKNPEISRAVSLHKMIRLVTSTLAGEGYLNFMGNEFGHPEWIDFPREGNNNSMKYARRQWSLVNPFLKYDYLNNFDNAMVKLLISTNIFSSKSELIKIHEDDKFLMYKKASMYFMFNFHTWKSQNVVIPGKTRKYNVILNTEDKIFGGEYAPGDTVSSKLVLPPRCALVLKAVPASSRKKAK